MKVTVTGAAGRLGSQTLNLLWENGYEVRATDMNFRRDLPVRVETASLLDRERCYALLEGSDALVHLGNHPHFHGNNRQLIFNENTAMNMNVFQAAVDVGVKRIVFASSIQAIGGVFPKWPETTSDRIPYFPLDGAVPPQPDNPYGLSKEIGERALRYFAENHGIVGFAIRYPQLLGNHTRTRPKGKGDANPWTAFSWLDNRDAAALIDTLLRCDLTGFHILTPTAPLYGVEPHTIAELSEKHFPGVPWKTPLEQATSFFDVAEITAATGWKPAIDDPLAE